MMELQKYDLGDTMSKQWSRRGFIGFMGGSTAVGMVATSLPGQASPDIQPLLASGEDGLRLVEGLNAQLLIAYGDPINQAGETFGYDNDFITWVPGDVAGEILLWVNHESVKPFLMHGRTKKSPLDPAQIKAEREAVGGSILKLRQEQGRWRTVADDPHNRRLHADTPIPFKGGGPVMGASVAKGTLANCAGGLTPWKTFLTCEENYDTFFGEVSFKDGQRTVSKGDFGWEVGDARPPEHYGWVVEIEPRTGKAAKLLNLGRFGHEAATCRAAGQHCVVYSGDDKNYGCFYKFISDRPDSLETGKLYVAKMGEDHKGSWELLDHVANPALAGKFRDRIEMLVRTREAALLAGGSKLARPEDIEIHPTTGAVYVCLTNNDEEQDYHGSILRLTEDNDNPLALTFHHETFLTGGEATGFSSPDNMAFDRKGNLWFTCDISESKMNKDPYKPYGNNGLYYVPLSGANAGKVTRMAAAPTDAEFTGPCFSPDGKQLFLSVQHPGGGSKPERITSTWPGGPGTTPRPGVVVISGALMDALMA